MALQPRRPTPTPMSTKHYNPEDKHQWDPAVWQDPNQCLEALFLFCVIYKYVKRWHHYAGNCFKDFLTPVLCTVVSLTSSMQLLLAVLM
jgi:hypothetical protein